MLLRLLASLPSVASVLLVLSSVSAAPADDAKSILATTEIHGGIIVQLGIGDGKLTAALHENDGTLVHGLDKDAAKVSAAREWMRAANIYGQVAVEQLTTPVLPYLDGMINLIVVQDQMGLPDDELMRVLAPNGCVYKDGKKTVKPKDARMDDWTHYLHGPSNGNPVSQDTAVGPPENLQWVGSPRWSRHHDHMSSTSGMVSEARTHFLHHGHGITRMSILHASQVEAYRARRLQRDDPLDKRTSPTGRTISGRSKAARHNSRVASWPLMDKVYRYAGACDARDVSCPPSDGSVIQANIRRRSIVRRNPRR